MSIYLINISSFPDVVNAVANRRKLDVKTALYVENYMLDT